ncbi:MAG: hypothetical protein AAB478_03830 [Patescibacteria group bacterium]
MSKFSSILLIVFSLSLLASRPAHAQEAISSGIATYIPLKGPVQEGDIIRLTKNGYDLTRSSYEASVFGVVAENPSVSFENTALPNTKPVISTGKVHVRVSTINGVIKRGDLITASSIPGVGQKATSDGYVIGTAIQDYTAKDSKAIGKILVVLNISFNAESGGVKQNLFSTFQTALTAPYLSPLNALRYLFAAALIIASFFIAVTFFGKISSLGIEAIGRNPLAGKLILLSVVFHVILAALIILVGVGVAYFMLVI